MGNLLKGIKDCFKGSKMNTTPTNGTQHAGNKPGSTQAPPSQENKLPRAHFDVSRIGQPGAPFDASRTATANGKPTQTGTHAIPAPPSQENKQPGAPFDASGTGPVNGKPTQTGTHAIPAPPSQENKLPGAPFDASRTGPVNGKPTQNVEPNQHQEEKSRNVRPDRAILGKSFKEIQLHYKLGKELGRGRSSIVYQCTEIFTGKTYACKSIPKENPANFNDEDVRREVKILKRLRQKPNIAEFKVAYEDSQSVHLVMELCTGGELLDKIIVKRNYSEREASSVFRSIVNIIYTCHTAGVMHRDIKPENFLLSTELENSVLKAIDFGSSVFIEEGMEYRDIVGTPYYVAPEVLRRCYNKEADIWSAGVILYILLCGVPPFRGETKADIFDAILSKELDLVSPPWSSISSSAKDLMKKILNKDPTGRISLLGILGHPWVQEGGEASDKPLDDTISRIKKTRDHPGRYNRGHSIE